MYQPRAYAVGTPGTCLRVGAPTTVYKALTNQGEVHQYIDHVVCFNTQDSHHPNKHTILHVFRARGYRLTYTIKLVPTVTNKP